MKNWLRKFKKTISLPIADQWILFRVFLVVLTMRAGLKFLTFGSFNTLYTDLFLSRKCRNVPDEKVRKIIWAIRSVSPSLSATCLPQALTLKYFLGGDEEAEIIIGVKKNIGLEAHAWVEKNGVILIGDLPETDFQPIWTWK
jgi:hypothetical protein